MHTYVYLTASSIFLMEIRIYIQSCLRSQSSASCSSSHPCTRSRVPSDGGSLAPISPPRPAHTQRETMAKESGDRESVRGLLPISAALSAGPPESPPSGAGHLSLALPLVVQFVRSRIPLKWPTLACPKSWPQRQDQPYRAGWVQSPITLPSEASAKPRGPWRTCGPWAVS